MGRVERIQGKECEHNWECMTGCGLLHGNLQNVAKYFEGDAAVKVMSYNKQQVPVLFDFNLRPAVCNRCSGIVSVPVFGVVDKEEMIVGTCPDCKGQVELVQDWNMTACPLCRKKGLHSTVIGMWD